MKTTAHRVNWPFIIGCLIIATFIFISLQASTASTSHALQSETFADNFDNGSGGSTERSGNDGSLAWSSDWSNDSGLWITQMPNWCPSGYCLRLIADSGDPEASSARQADLSNVSSATLSFDYSAYIGTSAGRAYVDISSNGTTFQTLDELPAQYGAVSKSYAIPASYLTANFRLRFRATGASPWTDLYVDNVVLMVEAGNPAPTNTPVVPPTETAVPSQFTFEKRINRSWDDVEERVTDGVIYQDSSDLELGDDLTTLGDQIVGLRFRNVQVPAGATITRAYLEFTVDEASSGATNVTIWGQYRGTAQAFKSSLYNVSSRRRTSAFANWNIPVWNSAGSTQQSVDLTAVVSEIISHPNWASGKKMAFIIEGSGERTAKSYDGDPTQAPLLYIEYNLGGSSPTPTALPPTSTATAPPPTVTPLPTNTPVPTALPPTPTPTGSTLSSGCGLSATTGHRYESVWSSGTWRDYYLSVPSGYNPTNGYNLVFGYHGYNYDGIRMRDYLRLEDTDAANNTIFVYPDGDAKTWPEFWSDNRVITGWRTGQLSSNVDFIFFDDMLAELFADYCIDTARVYVTGQSWGGDMASSLPCARGNKIAAATSVAANGDFFFTGYYGHYDKYPPIAYADCQRPVPMLTYRGAGDSFEAGEASNWWYGVNQCQVPDGNVDKEAIGINGRYEDSGCLAPNVYVRYSNYGDPSYIWYGLDHQIPADFETETMDFFLAHTLP